MVASPWKWQLPIREACATPSTGWPKTFGSEVGTRANSFPVVTRMAAAFVDGPSSAPAGERLMARAAHVSVKVSVRSKLSFFIGFLLFSVCRCCLIRCVKLLGSPSAGLCLVRQPEAGQRQAGEAEAEFLQRPAARDGLSQAFGEF